MRRLARLLTRVFFRRIEVTGAEHLPAGPEAGAQRELIDALAVWRDHAADR